MNSPQSTSDSGHRLENAVMLALRQRREAVTYAAEKHVWECDFVTKSEAIQVCAQLTPQNRQREINGALQAAALPGKRRPIVLTLDQRDRVTVDGVAVDIVPVWDWLTSVDNYRTRGS